MEDPSKLTKEEVGAIIQARYNSETRPPRSEEDRRIGKERLKEIDEYMKKHLKD
ncbi:MULTISPECIES: histidine kinase [Aerococcus]|uniref:Histidine kinase n=1 Tax=Aerococcus tenax TaxID=3078812 RepID=A0A329PKU4_9LACT|nr:MULTISPECIES: histidine kinase [Aerococcus]KAA9239749.1 histidine kinase [Aerococcus urinae]KAA9293750.1 histidine kinase [Aerococcus mictus]MCY3027105.1 histidine kinase [Aerococcus loyolae]MCY3066397.1 histidine kinase [Aerococcus mictus]MCY3083422.1 histidine kinase [Aerococcus mictus]